MTAKSSPCAGDGVSTFAVQITKSYGTEVTGADRAEKLDTEHSHGVKHVIGRTQGDFTTNGCGSTA